MIPFDLKLKLRHDLRVLMYMNRYTSQVVDSLVNESLDAFIDLWWTNHESIIEAMSSVPEWSWNDLAIIKQKSVAPQVDFVKAYYLFRNLIYRTDKYSLGTKSEGPVIHNLGNYIPGLPELMMELFEEIILDGLPLSKCKLGSSHNRPYISRTKAESYKAMFSLEENRPTYKGENNEYIDKFQERFGAKFGRFPEYIFETLNEDVKIGETSDGKAIYRYREWGERTDYESAKQAMCSRIVLALRDPAHRNLFKISFLRYLSVDKVSNKTFEGADKTGIISKMVNYFYSIMIALFRDISYSFVGENFAHQSLDSLMNGCQKNNGALKDINIYSFSDVTFKHKMSTGFHVDRYGDYYQVLALLNSLVHSTVDEETYVLSVHPCDIVNSSLGNGWSSCHGFSDNLHSTMVESFGVPYKGPGSSGGYYMGNFNFASGNGLIYYTPVDLYKGVDLWKIPRVQRMMLWVNNDLTAIRQNYFYPGRPNDAANYKRALELRVYLQNLFANFNGTVGTSDWVRAASETEGDDGEDYNEVALNGSYKGYEDPVFARSVVSSKKKVKRSSIIYSDNAYYFNIPMNNNSRWTRSYPVLSSPSYRCPVCGEVLNHPGYCLTHREELITTIDGLQFHPSEVLSIDGYFYTYEEFKKYRNKFAFCKDTRSYHEKYFAVTDGNNQTLYYHDDHHVDIGVCKECGKHFTQDILIDGYCPDHAKLSTGAFEQMVNSFSSGALALSFDSDIKAKQILLKLSTVTVLKWKSGKQLVEYTPPLDTVTIAQNGLVFTMNKVRYNGAVLDCSSLD